MTVWKFNDLKIETRFLNLFKEKKYNEFLKEFSSLKQPLKNDPKLIIK